VASLTAKDEKYIYTKKMIKQFHPGLDPGSLLIMNVLKHIIRAHGNAPMMPQASNICRERDHLLTLPFIPSLMYKGGDEGVGY
jgi:hypothetical protein